MSNHITNLLPSYIHYWSPAFHSFVFLSPEKYDQLDKLHNNYSASKTWGELKSAIYEEDFDILLNYYCDRLELKSDPSDVDEIDWSVFDLLYPDEHPMHPIIYQTTLFPPETDKYFHDDDFDGLRLSLQNREVFTLPPD